MKLKVFVRRNFERILLLEGSRRFSIFSSKVATSAKSSNRTFKWKQLSESGNAFRVYSFPTVIETYNITIRRTNEMTPAEGSLKLKETLFLEKKKNKCEKIKD